MSRQFPSQAPPAQPSARPSSSRGLEDDAGQALLQHFAHAYRDEPYFSTGRAWDDYEPAYRHALDSHAVHPGQMFGQVEAALARQWPQVCGPSRLSWAEARQAMQAAWHRACAQGAAAGRQQVTDVRPAAANDANGAAPRASSPDMAAPTQARD